jgi:hypothetical protein
MLKLMRYLLFPVALVLVLFIFGLELICALPFLILRRMTARQNTPIRMVKGITQETAEPESALNSQIVMPG